MKKNKTDYDAVLARAAGALRLVDETKPYGQELFEELNRLDPHIAIEVPCIRKHPKNGRLQVWLRLRGAKEAYSNQYEVGGSAIQNGEDIAAVIKRLGEKKFKAKVSNYSVLFPASFFNAENRGWYWHVVVAGFFEQDPPDRSEEGTGWFYIDELPKNSVAHHFRIINAAVNYFNTQTTKEEIV